VGTYFAVPKYFADEVYPLKYEDSIRKYSEQFGVDPALVAAVILQESRFNPKAQSSKGAQGLMQFMPTTAATMAKELGVKKYDIYDPDTSVMFGAAHLRDLLLKYNGDVDAALAGYNAGTGNADKWVKKGILGNIPFNETRNYVKKINGYRSVYATMYGPQLGIKNGAKIELKSTQTETVKIQGFVWSQIFNNVINFKWLD
jgi:soluble lytic murein transglycosylase